MAKQLKICCRYSHHVGHLEVKVTNIVTRAATNFQFFDHYSNKNQNIFLKFSAFVHHMCVLIDIKILAIAQTGCPPGSPRSVLVGSRSVMRQVRGSIPDRGSYFSWQKLMTSPPPHLSLARVAAQCG